MFEKEETEQLDLFATLFDKPKLPKHVRLIEFFAGIGAQAKALEILGADFEPWRTVEWSWQSITAYNAIHMGGKVEDTSDLTYEQVLDRIRGVSNDYNKPMDDKQLRAKKEKWARELLGRMLANITTARTCRGYTRKTSASRIGSITPTSSPTHSLAKTSASPASLKEWRKKVAQEAVFYGKSRES